MACSYRAHVAPGRILNGSGQTTEIGSEVVRFCSFERLAPEVTTIELSIDWPVPLRDGTKLKLVLEGRPIWADAGLGGMRIAKYEFRTRAKTRHLDNVRALLSGGGREALRGSSLTAYA